MYLPQRRDAVELRRRNCPIVNRLKAHARLSEDCALASVVGRSLTFRAANRPAAARAKRIFHGTIAAQTERRSVWTLCVNNRKDFVVLVRTS